MNWFIDTFRTYPSIPIFLTVGIGFLIGKLKYKTFSLGTVTSVLLVGVLVGQMNIPIGAPLKSLFFLLFLFAIGYKCGPQFAAALKGQGIKQVIFSVVICSLCLAVTWACAKIMNYNAAIATGLFSGAQTISAVIGIGTDTIGTLSISPEEKKAWIDLIPVCYAVTYVFGTIGSAWVLGNLGPVLLGGLKKVRQQTKELEQQLNHSSESDDPAMEDGGRPVSFRAYKVTDTDFFSGPKSVSDIEDYFASLGRRIFVERIKSDGKISPATLQTTVKPGDEIVLSGRHEYIVGDESWIGPEVEDAELLHFPVEKTKVMVSRKTAGLTVAQLRGKQFMHGVLIRNITRQGLEMPVFAQTKLMQGDMITIEGLPGDVSTAVSQIGFEEHPTVVTDMVFVALAIAIGAIVGAITLHVGKIPVSLSTSGGALISGLVFGWWRTRRPSIGYIPESSVWLMNNLGLNMFIAVIGIQAGPTFISGIKEVGWMLFLMGVISTSLPLILSIIIGDKIFKFHPAVNLGCCAGARTTTASLGAITASLNSSVPAMGYTVTYAIGNTLLILMGVAMVLLFV